MRRLLVLLAIALAFALPLRADEPDDVFLVLSDLHLNPFLPEGISKRGEDSSASLVESALDEARRQCPRPRFILLTGDLLAHHWEKLYAEHEPGLSFDDFTVKAVADIAGEMKERWPDTPILAVPGNDDSCDGNYQVRPDGLFLQRFSEIWAPLTGSPVLVRDTLAEGGYCSLPMPGSPERQLIGLNTVFFSANRVGLDDGSPLLEWLEDELARASCAGRRVWLVMHIPPGLDNYYTARAFDAGRPDPLELWRPEYLAGFLDVLDRYPGVVEVAFAGHTHRDDFRLLLPTLPCKIVPSISPVYGNNPGFLIFRTDLSNYQAHYLDLEQPTWKLEYDFFATYGLPGLDIARLESMLAPGSAPAQAFARYYTVSGTPEVTEANLEVYRNSMLRLTP